MLYSTPVVSIETRLVQGADGVDRAKVKESKARIGSIHTAQQWFCASMYFGSTGSQYYNSE